jgi:hypothetical protein
MQTYADEHGALGLARRRATVLMGISRSSRDLAAQIGRLDVDDIAREEGNAPAQMRR